MRLLDNHVQNTVLLASWLEKNGISRELQQYYVRSGWLESMGGGAFKRPKETVNWEGEIYSLQVQAQKPFHVGGLTSLSLLGLAHFVRLPTETVYIYSPIQTKLPKWFDDPRWMARIKHIRSSFLPDNTALFEFRENNIFLQISTAERAILECLLLAPKYIDLVECYQLFEGLANLRPKLVQELLEQCKSIKVKRLFLYMADKAKHQWLQFIDQTKIELGKGDRVITKGGVYKNQYKISIPKELDLTP